MTVFTIFQYFIVQKTQHLAYRGNFPLHMYHTVFKQNTKAAKVGK